MSQGCMPTGRRWSCWLQIPIIILGVCMGLVGSPQFAVAQAVPSVPLQISYQGHLTTAAGQPVTAPTSLTLRLYAELTGGAPVWEETHPSVPVTNGVFQVMLGSSTPLTVGLFDTARYLAVQAGSDAEMTPRQALGAAPFAIQAQMAYSLAPGATVSSSQIAGAVPGAVPWVVSGATQQAAPNTSYVAIGTTPAVITLPSSPVVGDVVKVASAGTGGWAITLDPGQTIGGSRLDSIWTAWSEQYVRAAWTAVAVSTSPTPDGNTLVAAASGEPIYVSTDSGATWTPRETARNWRAVASSADGTKLVAAV